MANIAQSETLYEPNKAWEYGMLFNNARSAHPPKLEAATSCSHSKAVIRTHITKYSLCMFVLWCIVKCLLNIIPAYPSNPQTTSQWKHSCLPPCYDSIRSAMTGSGLATPNASKETIRFLLRVKGDHSGDSAPHFLLGTSTWIHLCTVYMVASCLGGDVRLPQNLWCCWAFCGPTKRCTCRPFEMEGNLEMLGWTWLDKDSAWHSMMTSNLGTQ